MAALMQSDLIWSRADYWPELSRAIEDFVERRYVPEPMPEEAIDLASVQVEQLLLRLFAELVGDSFTGQSAAPSGIARLLARYQALFATSPRSAFLVSQELKALFDAVRLILADHRRELRGRLGAEQCQLIGQLLRQSAGAYYWDSQRQARSGRFGELPTMHVLDLLALAQQYAESAANANSAITAKSISLEPPLKRAFALAAQD